MKEKVVLKSVHPEQYGDLVIECRVIKNSEITKYLSSRPEESKSIGYKTGRVTARKGKKGEVVKTVLTTIVDGREYILHEEEGKVKERECTLAGKTVLETDYIVTNVDSTSNEEYIVQTAKIDPSSPKATYDVVEVNEDTLVCYPKYDPRVLTQVDENVMIETLWGEMAVCLKGSYIVTYDAENNDYNVLESGAAASTYTIEAQNSKTKKRS
jgi:hypothetical protein